MGFQYDLPKDKKQREAVIASMVSQGKSIRSPQCVRWWLAALYLQGLREFSTVDYTAGTVSVAYLNEAGILKFRYDEIVSKYMTQLGRLLAIDLTPRVSMKGVSLDGMRKASVAQIVLDSALPRDKVEVLKSVLCPALLMYGTVGVGLWIEGEDSQGIEVIMPWELLPIPVDASGHSGARGLMRVRPVPVDWVKRLAISPGARSKVYDAIEELKIPTGSFPVDLDTMDGGMSTTLGGGGFFIHTSSIKDHGMAQGKAKGKDEQTTPITLLVETWTETSDGYLAEYGVYAGMTRFTELYREDHTDLKYPMPVRVIRDIPTGSFWGRSYVDLLIPINNEIEYALSSIFESVADFDLYGLQLWPSTLGTPAEAQRGKDGLKRLLYEPDYTAPNLAPDNIEPAKMTGPMIDSIKLATELMDRVSNQPTEMLAGGAPGRVDSSAGLSFLYETSSIPLSPTAKHISQGMSGVFRALLRILKDKWTDTKVVSLSSLDDSLAGIVMDSRGGSLTLGMNAIPYPDEVEITVTSELPVSKAQMRAELKESLAQQRITIDEYNQMARKMALDLPIGDELGWQSYRRAILENLLLFGDGQTPGEVVVSQYDVARIHEQALLTFMARPEFYLASATVRDAFVEHLKEHRTNRGEYPEPMPYPEDIAGEMMGGSMMEGMGGGMPPQM